MTAAPRLNVAQRRHLAAQRAAVQRLASSGGHEIAWENTFTDIAPDGKTLFRSQDGWCYRGGHSHLRAVISAVNSVIIWRFGQPTERCPG